MNLFGILDVSGSALLAERQRAELVGSNMANAETTRTPEGGPYRRQLVVFSTRPAGNRRAATSLSDLQMRGVQVESVVTDPAPPVRRYEPSHPDADVQGYVAYPAINPVEEMADLLGAVRAYELNMSAVQATKSMIQQSLEILR